MVLFLGMGSQVVGTGSLDISGFNGDEGTVGVGNQTGVTGGIGYRGNRGGDGETMGGKVVSLGSSDSRFIDRDDGTVGVGNQTASIVAIVVGISSIAVVVGVSSIPGTGIVSVVESWGISVSTFGSKVGSFGSLDLRGLSGSNSTVGVGDELSRGSSHASEKNLRNSQ